MIMYINLYYNPTYAVSNPPLLMVLTNITGLLVYNTWLLLLIL